MINDEFLNNLQLLFSKPPSNGDWLEFYFRTAILLNGNGLAGQLCFPEVVYLVCKPKKSRCKTKAAKILQDFVSWRNSTIGHGTTSHDLEQIKEDLINRKEILEFILSESTFLENVAMYSYSSSGNKIDWSGSSLMEAAEHVHGEEQNFSVWLQRKDTARAFSLSPLIISNLLNTNTDY